MRFEYLTIRATIIREFCVSAVQVNGKKQDQWQGKGLHEVLNYYGQQGWDLIFVDKAIYVLKRAITSGE